MIENLYIDGKDAYLLYGVFVIKDGDNELLAFPSLKNVDNNDWAEEDGAEYDLSAPVLNTRELSIKFSCHGANARFGAFVEMLSDHAYHDFDFKEIGKVYRLRLVTQPNLSLTSVLEIFTLRFSNDFPLKDYTYVPPQSSINSIVKLSNYELDGRGLHEYGLLATQGSETEILKSPAVKKNLLQDIKTQSGAIYDGEHVFFQTKDVKLNFVMRASTLTGFWRNYNALLYDLSRPGERGLYVDATGYEYPCFYKGMAVKNFRQEGKIWLEFTLTLVFTSFRVEGEEFLLASEDSVLIITEYDDYAIDLD